MMTSAGKLHYLIATQFGVSLSELTGNPTFSDLMADSLDMIELVMQAEDALNIRLDASLPAFQEGARVDAFVAAALEVCVAP